MVNKAVMDITNYNRSHIDNKCDSYDEFARTLVSVQLLLFNMTSTVMYVLIPDGGRKYHRSVPPNYQQLPGSLVPVSYTHLTLPTMAVV